MRGMATTAMGKQGGTLGRNDGSSQGRRNPSGKGGLTYARAREGRGVQGAPRAPKEPQPTPEPSSKVRRVPPKPFVRDSDSVCNTLRNLAVAGTNADFIRSQAVRSGLSRREIGWMRQGHGVPVLTHCWGSEPHLALNTRMHLWKTQRGFRTVGITSPGNDSDKPPTSPVERAIRRHGKSEKHLLRHGRVHF